MNYPDLWCMLCLFTVYIISFYKIYCANKEDQILKGSVDVGVSNSAKGSYNFTKVNYYTSKYELGLLPLKADNSCTNPNQYPSVELNANRNVVYLGELMLQTAVIYLYQQRLRSSLFYISKSHNILKYLDAASKKRDRCGAFYSAVKHLVSLDPSELINEVPACLFKEEKQAYDDKPQAKLFEEPMNFQLRKKYDEKKLIMWRYVNEEFSLHDKFFFLRFFNWYTFEGKSDLVKFIKWVAYSTLYAHLRVAFYACTVWNHGRFLPWWLHFITGFQFRTEMKSLISKIYASESATMATSVNSAVSWVICSPLSYIRNVIQNEMPLEYRSQILQEQVLLGNDAYDHEYIMLSPA